MKENKHRNVVNYLDSYLVGESELWVSCMTIILVITMMCDGCVVLYYGGEIALIVHLRGRGAGLPFIYILGDFWVGNF